MGTEMHLVKTKRLIYRYMNNKMYIQAIYILLVVSVRSLVFIIYHMTSLSRSDITPC